MKVRRISSVILLIALASILQGCDQVKALLALAGIGVGTALQARPDRNLSYKIEIATNDGRILLFKGSTECSHSVNPNGYRGRYFTKSPVASTTVQDEEWVLSGINCDNEIVEKKPGQYLLYKIIDERQAKVYFVGNDGPARVTNATFDSTVISSSKAPRPQGFPYPAGPYLYQKVFFSTAPPAVIGLSEPIVVFQGTNVCGQQNSVGLSLSKEEFFEQFRRGTGMVAVEEGILAYQRADNAWSPVAGADPSTPMDAAASAASSTAEKLEYGCVRLLVNSRAFVVSESALGSFLYIPAEKAFYRVARTWYGGAQEYLKEQRDWSACAGPQESQDYRRGVMYRVDENAGVGVTKKTVDGSFVCRSSFRWLGVSGY